MWKCPVCDQENTEATVCPACGYDRTCDYEQYPTAFAVTAAAPTHILRREWREKQEPDWTMEDFTQTELFRDLVKQLEAELAYEVGLNYMLGRGVEKDEAQAVQWFRKGAELGDEDARYWLGVCYYHGQGVEQDYAQAAQLYQKAAEQGHKEAQLALADCYEQGLGVPRDPSLAKEWRAKAKAKNF